MKVVVKGNYQQRRFVPPPIPYERPEKKELKKSEYVMMKLRSDPAEVESQTYELAVPYFRSGTPEEWLLFKRALLKVIVGQNITTGPNKYAMARRLLEGDALAKFNEKALQRGNETNQNFDLVLRDVTEHVFPKRALAVQKRYMRRYMRKPRGDKTREYMARVTELNEYLREFPGYEQGKELGADCIMDIAEYAVPATWQRQMVVHGFDPLDHTVAEFVEFCERMEFTEETEDTGTKSKATAKQGSNGAVTGPAKSSEKARKKKRKSYDNSSDEEEPFCELHGYGQNHKTGKCRVLLAQAKKMRANYEAKRSKGYHYYKKQEKNKEKEELRTMVEDMVDRSLKKSKSGKKRKKEDPPEDNLNVEEFENLVLSDEESEDDD